MTSPARIDANRKNARNSTGPRTAAGKEKTRLNGLKHGLRSEEIVLPTESRSAFDSHLAAWMDDWKPPTETRRFLVERAATAAWRLKRCVRNETERLTERAFKAYASWDKARADRVEREVERIPRDPQAAINDLMATPEGVRRLSVLWNDLCRALLESDDWFDFDLHHNQLCFLLGINGENDSEDLQQVSRASLGLILRMHPDVIRDDIPPMSDAMAEEVRSMLRDICTVKIEEELWGHFQSLPEETETRDRHAESRAMAPHPEDATYHRYEGRLDREARAAIAQLMKLEQTGADLMALDDEPEAPSEPIAVASEPPTEANDAVPVVIAPSEANAVPAQGLVTQSDRDRSGRVWTPEANGDRPQSVGMPWLNQ